jgi:hypothetical protein
MDVKCPGCFNITTIFSHAQTVVLCGSCNTGEVVLGPASLSRYNARAQCYVSQLAASVG